MLVRTKTYLSFELHATAEAFAQKAIALENSMPWDGRGMSSDRIQAVTNVRQYAIGAVIVAVAGLEAMANELLDRARSGVAVGTLSHTMLQALATFETKRTNVLEKMNEILGAATLPRIGPGCGTGQQLTVLIELRKELVHNVPRERVHPASGAAYRPDPLEQQVRGRFKKSTIGNYGSFIWRCLSADCARWAVITCWLA